jgi:multicomponent Na+:H+ antiporter subunit D
MLTYLIVAEIGYMVGGIWLGNAQGITGATYHIMADAMMTSCLFMAVGCFIYKLGDANISSLAGIFKKMPLTTVGFLFGAFSMIGIPPTCGFFSKWFLISGAYQSGNWFFMAALLFSSLINAILFFRIIEVGYFGDLSKGHSHSGREKISEAPMSMVIPTLAIGVLLLGLGLSTNAIVSNIIVHVIPKGIL